MVLIISFLPASESPHTPDWIHQRAAESAPMELLRSLILTQLMVPRFASFSNWDG